MNDINTPLELYNYIIENITYGFISQDKKRYVRKEINNDELYERELFNNYYLQTPEELLNSKCGICYDVVELEREWFINHNYDVYTFYMNFHNHAFLIFSDGSSYNIIECTLARMNGLYKFDKLLSAMDFYLSSQKGENNSMDISVYSYDKPKFGSDFDEFIDNAKCKGLFK